MSMAVEFDEPMGGTSRPPRRASFFARLVMQTGIVKTEAAAQTVLLIVAVILIALSGFFFVNGTKEPPAPTPEQVVL